MSTAELWWPIWRRNNRPGDVKRNIAGTPVLSFALGQEGFTVDTDNCSKHIAFFGKKNHPYGTDRPVAYLILLANYSNCAYDNAHLERFSFVWRVLWLQCYLEGRLFTVRTDHDASKRATALMNSTCKLERGQLSYPKSELDVVQ